MKNGVVIVGAGHAGVQAAASLREEGFDGPVTLVGDEMALPYHKPPLSKSFIKDADARPQLLRGEIFYSQADIGLRLGTRIESIELPGRRLDLAGGGHIAFDRVILATGSRPRSLVFPGSQFEGVLSLRSLDDAVAIRALSTDSDDVVILGGGFIGLEIAATLASGGRRVTVIEAQHRLLGRAVAPIIAGHVLDRLADRGIRVLLSTMPERLEGKNGHVTAVVTASGERIAARMVIVGVGVVPNVELAEQARIATANGIRVNQHLQSSQPEILAIGDCASYRHWSTGADVRLESVQNATDHARLAARTIAGHAEAYASVPWFWSDIGDMKLQMVGLAGASDRTMIVGDLAENRFSVFHYNAHRLIAIESVNRPADHMLGRKMIAAGFTPSAEAMASGDVKSAFLAWQQAQPVGSAP